MPHAIRCALYPVLCLGIASLLFQPVFAQTVQSSFAADFKTRGYVWIRGTEDIRNDQPHEDTRTFRNRIYLEGQFRPLADTAILFSALSDYLWLRNDGRRDDLSLEVFEAYVRQSDPKWDLRVGNQIVRWGKTDEISPVDNVNPQDLRQALTLKLEDRKLPVFMARLQYFTPDGALEAIYLPHFRSSKLDFFESDWAVFNHLRQEIKDGPGVPSALKSYLDRIDVTEEDYSTGIDNSEIGVRYTGTARGRDYGLSYFYSRSRTPFIDRFPITNISVEDPSGAALLSQISQLRFSDDTNVHVIYPRNQIWGAEMETTRGPYGIRGEMAYMTDRVFLNSDLTSTKKGIIHYVLGVDRTFANDLYANLQVSQRKIFNYDERIIFDREFETAFFLRLGKNLFYDKLRLKMDLYYNVTDNSYYLNPEIEFRYFDNLPIAVGANILDGPDDSLLGYYGKNDQAYVTARLVF
ncbi:MAG: DUF1302 family protein [Pseudomonadota bacterium]